MAEYQVELSHKAVKHFLNLPTSAQGRIRAKIDGLADDRAREAARSSKG